MAEERDEGWLTIAAVGAGIGTALGFGAVFWEYYHRRTFGWHVGLGLDRLLARGGAAIGILALGVLALSLGGRLIRLHSRRGMSAVVVGATIALAFGIMCVTDEIVLAETALLLDPDAGAMRPWENSIAHKPNAWLRYQLLRGCGAACVVMGVGLIGSIATVTKTESA